MAPQPRSGSADEDPLDRLHELAVLRDEGALTAAEFEARKALVLRQPWAGMRDGGDAPAS